VKLKVGDRIIRVSTGEEGTITKVYKSGGNIAGIADWDNQDLNGPVRSTVMRYAISQKMIVVVSEEEDEG
jgi:hypothetical protein